MIVQVELPEEAAKHVAILCVRASLWEAVDAIEFAMKENGIEFDAVDVRQQIDTLKLRVHDLERTDR